VTGARQRLGRSGERLAAEYLQRHGHRLLARNVRLPEGEIDLVTLDGATLVLVEVKLRRGAVRGAAREALTAAKRRRLAALAAAYAAAHPELPADLRIDLVAVQLAPDGALAAVEHVVSAVEEAG
jgi:putative endonuclease